MAAASFFLMVGLPVLAQGQQEAAKAAPEAGSWKALSIAIVLGIAIGVGCFMSPKRSHQD